MDDAAGWVEHFEVSRPRLRSVAYRMLGSHAEADDAVQDVMGALRETRGAEAVANLLSGGARGAQLAIIDGVAGLVWAPQGHTRGLIELTVVEGRIVAISVTGDAERIGLVDIVLLDTGA